MIPLLLAAALAGCGRPSPAPLDAPNRFPIGVLGVDDAGRLQELRESGFDAVGAQGGAPGTEAPVVPSEVVLLRWSMGPAQALAQSLEAARRAKPKGSRIWLSIGVWEEGDIPHLPPYRELRLRSYLAIVRGVRGLFYHSARRRGRWGLLDFPEEWQVLLRLGRELKALQPVLERGEALPSPWTAPGIESRRWRLGGRDYAVLLNDGPARACLPEAPLRAWRPLFEVRRDLRDVLPSGQGVVCLDPGRVLALEGPWRLELGGR